jgi:hypothetical protein
MTDTQKIDALVNLLNDVMHTLSMKQYEIEDATQSHQCEVEADAYHQKMIDILHGVPLVEPSLTSPKPL